MKSTKAQGISFNVIVIAAVALIVLVVLLLVFTGRIGKVTTGIEEATAEAKCAPKGSCEAFCSSEQTEILAKTECIKNTVNIHCCVQKE